MPLSSQRCCLPFSSFPLPFPTPTPPAHPPALTPHLLLLHLLLCHRLPSLCRGRTVRPHSSTVEAADVADVRGRLQAKLGEAGLLGASWRGLRSDDEQRKEEVRSEGVRELGCLLLAILHCNPYALSCWALSHLLFSLAPLSLAALSLAHHLPRISPQSPRVPASSRLLSPQSP
ncbi:unnamed protein product [Closterium sp. NIES-64]|nr:unnamed protein product [Closterium sp. NIES-64]